MPRILVSDEHGVYRTGLRRVLETEIPNVEVVEASSLSECFSRIRSDEFFDLVLMNLNLSDVRSLEALKSACESLRRAASQFFRIPIVVRGSLPAWLAASTGLSQNTSPITRLSALSRTFYRDASTYRGRSPRRRIKTPAAAARAQKHCP